MLNITVPEKLTPLRAPPKLGSKRPTTSVAWAGLPAPNAARMKPTEMSALRTSRNMVNPYLRQGCVLSHAKNAPVTNADPKTQAPHAFAPTALDVGVRRERDPEAVVRFFDSRCAI